MTVANVQFRHTFEMKSARANYKSKVDAETSKITSDASFQNLSRRPRREPLGNGREVYSHMKGDN